MCDSPPSSPTPETPRARQPRYDGRRFNFTHLRESERDASRGAKQQALKNKRILSHAVPMLKRKGTWIQGIQGLYK